MLHPSLLSALFCLHLETNSIEITNLIHKVNTSYKILTSLLSKESRKLLKYQNQEILKSDSEDSETGKSEIDHDNKIIQNALNFSLVQNLALSKNDKKKLYGSITQGNNFESMFFDN